MGNDSSPSFIQPPIEVEVVSANLTGTFRQRLTLRAGAHLQDVRRCADLLPELCAAWDMAAAFSVFGSLRAPDDPLSAGDRIEILRPLVADPKQARQERVRAQRQARARQGLSDRWTRGRSI